MTMDFYEYIVTQTAAQKIDPSTAAELMQFFPLKPSDQKEDIAVIGMATKFPNADSPSEYWRNICRATNNISVFPEDRKNDAAAYFRLIGQQAPETYLSGAYLNHVDQFDADYFGISPLEANLMDLNQRLFLQTAILAIEDAGYSPQMMSGSNTGIFLGYSDDFCQEYKSLIAAVRPDMLNLSASGNVHSIIASRLAYIFDFKGPALLIDTACSSALVAIHMAVQGLRNGDCETALVGGSKLSLVPGNSMLPIASSDGRCRAFDDRSDGTGFGEGVAAVLLKPLSKAQRDNDMIYALIKGSAVNQDGESMGITAPNSQAQAEVLEKAWRDAGISPETITYIETHGTGTKLGDPVEIDGISKAFRKFTRKNQFCAISSAKSSVGHLDHLAGMASFCKAVLSLKNQMIPPTLHFQKPNRNISFVDSPVYVNDHPSVWERKNIPHRCGVSSFGISGTNCHIVLEEYPNTPAVSVDRRDCYLFMLSSKSERGLRKSLENIRTYLVDQETLDIEQLCYSAQCCREHYLCRIVFLIKDIEELKEKIDLILKKDCLINMPEDDIYFNFLRVIPVQKKKEEGEVYQQELDQASAYAGELVKKDQTQDNLRKLCVLYTECAAVPWNELYQEKPGKIHLPGYAFLPVRHWLTKAKKDESNNNSIRCLATTSDQRIYSTTLNASANWVLTDHKLNGHPLLPGTAYVDILRKIAQDINTECTMEISNLLFLRPLLCLNAESRELYVILKRTEDTYRFRIESEVKSGEWLVHAEGTMKLTQEKPSVIDLNLFRQRFSHNINIPAELSGKTDSPLSFGDRWNNVESVSVIEREGFASLVLAPSFQSDLTEYPIHPALLDNAANFAIQSIGDELYLPWVYKQLKVYSSLPSRLFSYLKMKEENTTEFAKFDLRLFDPQGRVLAEAKDYTVKKVNSAEMYTKPGPLLDNFTVVWKKRGMQSAIHSAINPAQENIVLFYQPDAQPIELIQALKARGHKVYPYVLNRKTDYTAVLSDVSVLPSANLFFCALRSFDPLSEARQLKQILNQTVYSFSTLIQGLVKMPQKPSEITVTMLCRDVYEITGNEMRLQPHYAPLLEMGKVIQQEYSHIRSRAFDVDMIGSMEDICDALLTNHVSYYTGIRNGELYEKEIVKINTELLPERTIEIKENGVYLLTGGMGGIGLEVARHLASKEKVTLILAQRSALPPRSQWNNKQQFSRKIKISIEAIQEIENGGSTVSVYSVDVTDEEQVKTMIASVRSDYGSINGVVHMAGIPGVGYLMNKKMNDLRRVIDTKVLGAWNLDHYTVDDQLDFLILFSSFTSLIGGIGQSDYTAANSYLDAFAYERNRTRTQTYTMVVNWGPWKETGMAADFKVPDKQVMRQMTTKEALDAFDWLFKRKIVQVLIGNPNLEEIKAQAAAFPVFLPPIQSLKEIKREKSGKHNDDVRGIQSLSDGIKDEEVLELTKQVWEKVLEIENIDIYQSFSSLGGDSIIAAYLVAEMGKLFGSAVDIIDIFAYPSVSELAGYIRTKILEQKPDWKSAVALSIDKQKFQEEDDDDYLDELITKIVDGQATHQAEVK